MIYQCHFCFKFQSFLNLISSDDYEQANFCLPIQDEWFKTDHSLEQGLSLLSYWHLE